MRNTHTGITKSIKQVIQPQKVAIQGYEGSFHQEAARKFFGNAVEVICCATFRDVVKIAANSKLSTGGVMAIENSIAGSILPNYNLLIKSNLSIVGEIYLQIKQQLMVNPGIKLEDIHEVHSHPMAIQQCFGFLDQYNWKLVESEDTALSAKSIARHRSKHIAAIASKLAAEIYFVGNWCFKKFFIQYFFWFLLISAKYFRIFFCNPRWRFFKPFPINVFTYIF
jgi:prephenate dehydratase